MKNIFEKIESKIIRITESGCWVWMGGCVSGGYSSIWFNKMRTSAHRVTYEIYRGKIPVGLDLDHLCRVRCCVNPWHLEAVTRQVNIRRGLKCMPKTHCKKGHELSTENLYIRPHDKLRMCRKCRKIEYQEYVKKLNGCPPRPNSESKSSGKGYSRKTKRSPPS